jgi:PAS domain S-box-containing protein
MLALTLILLMSVYTAAFPYLIRTYGPTIRLFSIVFILPAAFFRGIRIGLIAGIATVALNIVLHLYYGITFEGGIIGPVVGLTAVVVVGRLSDLQRQLQAKIYDLRLARDALSISETKYRTLFEMESDAVFLVETDTWEILDVNRASEELFGYSREEFLGMRGQDLAEEPEKAIAVMKRGSGKLPFLYARKKDGEIFPFELTVRHFELLGRRVSLGTLRDSTFRRQAETERRKLERELQQTRKMEAIGTLAGGIAHDFNNILSAIIGYSELMQHRKETLDDQQQLYLEQVLGAANRAKELVFQILTFSRQSEVCNRVISVAPIIQEALKLLKASLPAAVEIRSTLKAKRDTIVADPTQIYQVVMNLCTNAAQALPNGCGGIEIALSEVTLDEAFSTLHPEIEPGPHLCLQVADTGHGMTGGTLERIFDPYFTTKDKGKGTGLGLSVVHGVVLKSNGCILVESEPEKGSRFNLYFPLAFPSRQSGQALASRVPRGDEHILIVDDEKALCKMMAEMLKKQGYQVQHRSDSREALALFRSATDKFDIVITDMDMPNMSGLRLRNEIAAINPEVPVLVCTGYGDLLSQETAESFGFKRLLRKPVPFRELAMTVRETLNKHKKQATVALR